MNQNQRNNIEKALQYNEHVQVAALRRSFQKPVAIRLPARKRLFGIF